MNTTSAAIMKPRGNKVPVKTTSAIRVSGRTINGLAQVFKLLADESRLKILLALSQDGELHVTALCDLLDQTQPDLDLCVAKVIVPGMRHFWRRLGPGRLYDVPVRMGQLTHPTTEERMNPWNVFF